MLYVYIINIFIYLSTRPVLGLVPVRFGYFGYKKVGTLRVLVWFRFQVFRFGSGSVLRFRLFYQGLDGSKCPLFEEHVEILFTRVSPCFARDICIIC